MANNKKVLTVDNLVTFKKLLDEEYLGVDLDSLEFKTINGESIVGSGNIVIKASDGDASVALLATPWKKNYWYNWGDVVSYNKKIYYCTNSHQSGSSFSSSNWESTTIFDAVLNKNYVTYDTAYSVANNAASNYFNNNFNTRFDSRLNSQFNSKFDTRLDATFETKLDFDNRFDARFESQLDFDTRFSEKFDEKFDEKMNELLNEEM